MHKRNLYLVLAMLVFSISNLPFNRAFGQTTAFTYQGRVTDNGTNFTGAGQFKFALVTSTNANSQATATAVVTSGFVTSINVVLNGNGYVSAPAVTISGGGGGGAVAHASISGGAVTSITVDNAGTNYASAPTVTIAAPPANISYTTYWSNDGTSQNGSEPAAAVGVGVTNGLFMIALGDNTVPNMTAISAAVFGQPNLQLRIWFSDGVNSFAALNPVQNLTPTPYAVAAQSVNGLLSVQQNSSGSPNIVAGASVNTLANGVVGATIAGGGATNYAHITGIQAISTSNSVVGDFGTVGGGAGNSAGTLGVVGGGDGNQAFGTFYGYATVAGGNRNEATNDFATIGGGEVNFATGYGATVSGGSANRATGLQSAVPGGTLNWAGGKYSFAAGQSAWATNDGTFVWADSSPGTFASKGNDQFLIRAKGGVGINANPPSATLDVNGSMILDGTGLSSLVLSVLGNRGGTFANPLAQIQNSGSAPALRVFTSGLSSPSGALSVSVQNAFDPIAMFGNSSAFVTTINNNGSITAPAFNGSVLVPTNGSLRLSDRPIYLRTGSDINHGLAYNGQTVTNFGTGQFQSVDGPVLFGFSGGVLGTRNGGDHAALQWTPTNVTVYGTFNNNSDRNVKQDFASVTPAEILNKVAQLPLSEWSYKVDASTRHIGPMAQDFYSTFNVGTDEKHIAPIDEGGVALAAIQGLNEKLEEQLKAKDTEIEDLKTRLEKLEKTVEQRKSDR